MVLQVIRQKTSSQFKCFIEQNWRLRKEWIAHAIVHMGENSYVVFADNLANQKSCLWLRQQEIWVQD